MESRPPYLLQLQASGRAPYYTKQCRTVLGRSQECDWIFPEATTISRKHATVYFGDGKWYLMDNGSHNGTWLNKKPIAPHVPYPLIDGDEIDLAHTKIIYVQALPAGVDPTIFEPPRTCSMAPPPNG